MTLSVSRVKQFDLLALKVNLYKDTYLTVVGCYRPPSVTKETIFSLHDVLLNLNDSEVILMGDLNWEWLSPASENIKDLFVSLNLTQLIDTPTRLNPRDHSKSTLLDVIFTNMPHKYTSTAVFCNDVSDHCAIACIRDTKLPKHKSRYVFKRCFKRFNEQAFIQDLYNCNLETVCLIPDVEHACEYFHDAFSAICNKHAPVKKFRISGRNNPWFTEELSFMIRERNVAWGKAQTTNSTADWTAFRILRNKFTSMTRKAKSDYYLKNLSENLNNPSKFWKQIKSLSGSNSFSGLPQHIFVNSVEI